MSTTPSQQFEGRTIEDALAAAVDALGDDLEILDAQKVRRRRMLGVGRRDRFEVVASKRSLAEPKDFEDVLKRMVDRVDDAERRVQAPVAVERDWWRDAEFVVPDQPDTDYVARRSAPPVEVDVRQEPAVATPAPAATITVDDGAISVTEEARALVGQVAAPATSPRRAADPAPVAPPVDITIEVDDPVWSQEALLGLDLPPALVDRIRPTDPTADLEWVAATAGAVAELLETAEPMSGPCELTGHGAASAVHLIRGACDGFRLDSLIIDGRRVPATPLELALAIRSLLRGES